MRIIRADLASEDNKSGDIVLFINNLDGQTDW